MHTAHYHISFMKMNKCRTFSLTVKLIYLILLLENMEPPCCIPGLLPTYYIRCKYYSEHTFRMHAVVSSK